MEDELDCDTGASRGIPGDADCVLKILGGTKNDVEGDFFPPRKYQYMQKATQCETVCML